MSSARVERRTDCWSRVRPRTAAAVSSTDTTVLREPPPLDGASARRPPCVVDPRTSGLRGSRKIAAVEMLYRGRRRPRRGLQHHRRLHHGLRYRGSGRRQRHQPLLSLWYTREAAQSNAYIFLKARRLQLLGKFLGVAQLG